jgi:heme/copper-type cytochrome/quinol oxidase subunit 2
MSEEKLKKNIINILIVFSAAFLLLIGYLSYIDVRYGESYVSNPYNKRIRDRENEILRKYL